MACDISKLQIFTIGAYGFDEDTFLNRLKTQGIDTFCDIRLRRGMRGAKYAWANSNRLQANLKNISINYVHVRELAPSKEIREKQKEEDQRWGVSKRERTKLGRVFTDLYKEICITEQNISIFFQMLPSSSTKIALFCVEKEPDACHRSILARHLCEKFNLSNGGDIGEWKP